MNKSAPQPGKPATRRTTGITLITFTALAVLGGSVVPALLGSPHVKPLHEPVAAANGRLESRGWQSAAIHPVRGMRP